MNYLMIQNAGVAPTEAFTLLGMSLTRDDDTAGLIGQFGSGNKHAINLLLRLGIKFYIYCGKTRLEFFTRPETIGDGIVEKEVLHVMCKFGGTSCKTIDCGWTLDFGATDWTTVDMALREFVSNAIDRTIRGEKEFIRSIMDGRLSVTTVNETQRRAADGFTRVYIELNDAVRLYYAELPRRFLHFSDNPDQVYQSILPKAERNLTERRTPMIYRCGVLIREIQETRYPSLFDYNFNIEQIKIDECRNSNEWTTRAACAKLMKDADPETLATIMKSMVQQEETFESRFDADYVLPCYVTPDEASKENWTKAWNIANEGGPAIMCVEGNTTAIQTVKKKGYTAKSIKSQSWVAIAKRMGVQNSTDILTDDEQKGREMLPATDAAINAVNTVWAWLEALGMTKGKDKPEVRGYRELMDAESGTMGYWEEGSSVVHIREDISTAVNEYTLKVALEEVTHYVTGSTDCSRDFQQFLIDGFVKLAV